MELDENKFQNVYFSNEKDDNNHPHQPLVVFPDFVQEEETTQKDRENIKVNKNLNIENNKDRIALPSAVVNVPPTKMTSSFICLVLANSCGFLVTGYQMAVISGLVLLNKDIPSDPSFRENLVGISSAMAMVVTLTCGQLCDKIGRRRTVMLSAFLAILAEALECSGLYHTLPGRVFAGISIGLSTLSVPIYLAESTSPSMRGRVMLLNMAALTFGQLLSGIAAAAFNYFGKNGWRFLSGIILIPSILQLVGLFFLPESFRFLAKKGKLEEAEKVMKLLWKNLPEKEFKSMITNTNENTESSSFQILCRIIRTPSVRRALLLGCSLHIMNQMSGINIVIFYSGMVVKMAGVFDDRIAMWLSIVPTLINFLGTFIGFYLVERIGRRFLLLTSTAGVIASLISISFIFWQVEMRSAIVSFIEPNMNSSSCAIYRTCSKCVMDPLCGFCYEEHPTLGPVNGSCLPSLHEGNPYSQLGRCNSTDLETLDPSTLRWEPSFCPSDFIYYILVGQILYILFFASGLGPLPWTICSEIYPMWSRSICNSISSSVLWLFSWIMTGNFLTMTRFLTIYGSFILMAFVCLFGWIFWFFFLPETKGKSLEEIGFLFQKEKELKRSEPTFL